MQNAQKLKWTTKIKTYVFWLQQKKSSRPDDFNREIFYILRKHRSWCFVRCKTGQAFNAIYKQSPRLPWRLPELTCLHYYSNNWFLWRHKDRHVKARTPTSLWSFGCEHLLTQLIKQKSICPWSLHEGLLSTHGLFIHTIEIWPSARPFICIQVSQSEESVQHRKNENWLCVDMQLCNSWYAKHSLIIRYTYNST